MSRQSRIESYGRPASKEWWDGRSNKPAIDRWSERAAKNSDGAKHRASSGDVKLPSTGGMDVHSTHQSAGQRSDPYDRARADKNHDDKLSDYLKGVRRES
jgi:hypothetical protein